MSSSPVRSGTRDGLLELLHNFSAGLQSLALVVELVREPLLEPRADVLPPPAPIWRRAPW